MGNRHHWNGKKDPLKQHGSSLCPVWFLLRRKGSLSSALDAKGGPGPDSILLSSIHWQEKTPFGSMEAWLVDIPIPKSAPVWIRFRNIPYHLWSRQILFALARAVASPFVWMKQRPLKSSSPMAACLWSWIFLKSSPKHFTGSGG